MPSPKRTTIQSRRTAGGVAAAAIRDDPRSPVTVEEVGNHAAAGPASEMQHQEGESSQQPEVKKSQSKKSRSKTPAGKTDVSLYWRGATYDEVRRAFWYDYSRLQGEGPLDTLRAWIAAAIDVHNTKSTDERVAIVKALGEVDRTAGKSGPRPFAIDSAVVAEMEKQLLIDRTADPDGQRFPEWPSTSNYVEAAVRAAVEKTKRRAGGELPTAPKRLPIKGRLPHGK